MSSERRNQYVVMKTTKLNGTFSIELSSSSSTMSPLKREDQRKEEAHSLMLRATTKGRKTRNLKILICWLIQESSRS